MNLITVKYYDFFNIDFKFYNEHLIIYFIMIYNVLFNNLLYWFKVKIIKKLLIILYPLLVTYVNLYFI